uniref:Uncharacterized protein n=1 Tax=Heliothis virescens TaxID=7102 RepID=A0A2A4K9V8_HELVI
MQDEDKKYGIVQAKEIPDEKIITSKDMTTDSVDEEITGEAGEVGIYYCNPWKQNKRQREPKQSCYSFYPCYPHLMATQPCHGTGECQVTGERLRRGFLCASVHRF